MNRNEEIKTLREHLADIVMMYPDVYSVASYMNDKGKTLPFLRVVVGDQATRDKVKELLVNGDSYALVSDTTVISVPVEVVIGVQSVAFHAGGGHGGSTGGGHEGGLGGRGLWGGGYTYGGYPYGLFGYPSSYIMTDPFGEDDYGDGADPVFRFPKTADDLRFKKKNNG